MALSFSEQLPTIGKLTVTGTGSFNRSPAEGSMNMDISVPNASSLGAQAASILSNLKLNLVFANKTVDVQLPPSLSSMAGSVTGGKSWVSVNLAQLASAGKIPGLSSALSGPASSFSPTSALKRLEQASSSGVAKVGNPTVNGVATTEYSGSLDLSKVSSELPASRRAAVRKMLAQGAAGFSTVPYHVFIDASNLIRRLNFSFAPTLHGVKVPVSGQIDYLAYGKQAAPSLPAPSAVFSLNGVLNGLASNGAGGATSSGAGVFGG